MFMAALFTIAAAAAAASLQSCLTLYDPINSSSLGSSVLGIPAVLIPACASSSPAFLMKLQLRRQPRLQQSEGLTGAEGWMASLAGWHH